MTAQAMPKLDEAPATRVVHKGTQDLPKDAWVPFEWDEPRRGHQVCGEIAIVRPFGTSGNLTAGFWRSRPNGPGMSSDGSVRAIYSAPLGDETAVVLEGTATLTVKETRQRYRVSPGSIICSPKNVEVVWEFDAPYFKKFWCIFDGSYPTPNPPKDLLIANINDNPAEWQEYRFTEPKEGPQVAGELFFIRERGATSTMMCGLWRSGKGIAGTNVDASGTLVTPLTSALGDETILLLEGEIEVVETLTRKKHSFRAGDVIGLSSGMHVTGTAKGPFTKKLWVITKDQLPE
jgi:uncharacterized cupin superfamily protein